MFPMHGDALLPTLDGVSVVLRPVTADDAAGLVTLLSDKDVRRLTGTHGPVRPGALQRAADYYASRAEDTSTMHLAITERTTGAFIGEAVLSDIDDENLSCSFRIALVGARVTGRGYGTETTRLIVDHALNALALHRVELEVLAFNPRARRVYEKVGFVSEGVKRQAVRWDGAWIDVEIMAVLAITEG